MKQFTLLVMAVAMALTFNGCTKKPKAPTLGKITTIETGDKKIWVDEGKKTKEYYWDGETKVVTAKGPANIEALKADDKIKITFKTSGGKRVATEIELKEKKAKEEAPK